jgi:hypothetical protein
LGYAYVAVVVVVVWEGCDATKAEPTCTIAIKITDM